MPWSVAARARPYVMPGAGLASFTVGAFTWSTVAGWMALGAALFALDWYGDRAGSS